MQEMCSLYINDKFKENKDKEKDQNHLEELFRHTDKRSEETWIDFLGSLKFWMEFCEFGLPVFCSYLPVEDCDSQSKGSCVSKQ